MNFSGHKVEGFAIDWSPVVPGRLVSGILSLFPASAISSIYFFVVIASYKSCVNVTRVCVF